MWLWLLQVLEANAKKGWTHVNSSCCWQEAAKQITATSAKLVRYWRTPFQQKPARKKASLIHRSFPIKLPLAGQTKSFYGGNQTQLQPANPLPNPPTTAQLLLVGHAFALSLSDIVLDTELLATCVTTWIRPRVFTQEQLAFKILYS